MAQEYILKTQGLRDVIQNMKKNFPDGIWMVKVSKIEYQKTPNFIEMKNFRSSKKKDKTNLRQGECESVKMLVVQSCPTLCNPMECRPLGSSVHGILQARTLEWVPIPFSRGSSLLRDRTCVS